MAFDSELEAFRAYAASMPNNVVFVIDTYDTLQGARNAVEVGRELRERGHELVGVRIDSGDLAWLSKRVREILDEGGFSEAKIVASNELDEHLIASLKDQGAAIDVWGVGTKLATSWEQPALGGVYKLSAIRRDGGDWEPRIKLSEQTAKVTTPGVLGVRRYRDESGQAGRGHGLRRVARPGPSQRDGRSRPTRRDARRSRQRIRSPSCSVPVFRDGNVRLRETAASRRSRARSLASVGELDPSITRFLNPHTYPVGLEQRLNERADRARACSAWTGILTTARKEEP